MAQLLPARLRLETTYGRTRLFHGSKLRAMRGESARAIAVSAKTVSAIWDFGPSLSDGELAPGEMSAEKTLRFHLADLRPFDWCLASSVSHSSTRVFSALSENESFG